MMKTAVFFLTLSVLSVKAYAHEYFFAFAEVEYNAAEQCFEVTLEGSAHDVEDVMNEQGITIRELEDHYADTVMRRRLELFIEKGFSVTTGGRQPKFRLVGYEVMPNGLVDFYLRSEPVILSGQVDFRFDWLMDALPGQQNKITFINGGEKFTEVFLPHQRNASISLKKDE